MPLSTVLLVGAAWLARELGGLIFRRLSGRVGTVGYVIKSAGFFAEVELVDGQRMVTTYYPDYGFRDEPWHDLVCEGTFFNDTDAAVFLKDPRLLFLHPEGRSIMHDNPRVFVEGVEQAMVQIPAQGTCNVRVTVRLSREQLERNFASMIPVLQLEDIRGKTRTYRVANTSITGRHLALWPRRGDVPVFAHKSDVPTVVEKGNEPLVR